MISGPVHLSNSVGMHCFSCEIVHPNTLFKINTQYNALATHLTCKSSSQTTTKK